jgi:hypothetical protein
VFASALTDTGANQNTATLRPGLANYVCAWCHEVRKPFKDHLWLFTTLTGDLVWLCTTCYDEEMRSIDGDIYPISSAVAIKACPPALHPEEQPQPWRKAARKAPPPQLLANRPVQNPTVRTVSYKAPPPQLVATESLFGSPPPKGPPPAVEKAAIIGGSLTGPPPPQRQRDSPRAGYAFINGVETCLNTPAVGWMNHYCRAAVQLSKFPGPRTTLEGEYQIAVKSSVKMPPPRTRTETDMQVAVKMGGRLLGCRPPAPKPPPGHC